MPEVSISNHQSKHSETLLLVFHLVVSIARIPLFLLFLCDGRSHSDIDALVNFGQQLNN